jgi:hypothetical protein
VTAYLLQQFQLIAFGADPSVIVVLDTNVWISALQFAKHRGTPTQALAKAMSEDIIATCGEIESDFSRFN